MWRIGILLILFSLYLQEGSAQLKPFAFEDLEKMQSVEPRPVVVLIMTSWCKYCHSMKNTMLKNKEVSKILSERFYVVFLNAEERKDIIYAGRKFKFKPSGVNTGFHELAEHLGTINGQLAFPSISLLNETNEIIYQHEGFLDASSLANLLKTLVGKLE